MHNLDVARGGYYRAQAIEYQSRQSKLELLDTGIAEELRMDVSSRIANFGIAIALFATVLLAGCSHSDSKTLVGTADMTGVDSGMTVTLTLNDFAPATSRGSGTIAIVKQPGRELGTVDGTHTVEWSWIQAGKSFRVVVPDAHAGVDFRPSPLDAHQDSSASAFLCMQCSRNDRDALGALSGIPDLFKTSN